ncbi:MAG: methyl-accepting chemotaxis protein [Spirochaetia bacterium]
MKNMKMAAKIGVGFGVVIAIMLALGGLAYVNMMGVQGDTGRLDRETVPQLAIASSIARSAELTSANTQAFSLTLQQSYFDQANTYLGDMGKSIADAESLSAKYPRLIVLRQNSAAARDKLKELNDAFGEANLTQRAILSARGAVDVAAQSFMKIGSAYLADQNRNLAGALRRQAGFGATSRLVARINGMYELFSMVNALALAANRAAAVDDPAVLSDGIDGFSSFPDKLSALTQIADPEDQSTLQQLTNSSQDFANACKDVLAGMQKMATVITTSNAATQAVLDAATQTSQEGMKDASTIVGVAVSRIWAADIMLFVGLAAAVLLGIAVALSITRAITRPLSKAVAFAQTVAGGDFTATLDISQKDEVGSLAAALNGMTVTLKNAISTVQKNAAAVSESSGQIYSSAQKLSEGAQSQASTLEETSASVEELSASVDQVAEHAKHQAGAVERGSASMAQVHSSIEVVSKNLTEIADLASRSVDNAQEGANAVSEVVDGINLIAGSSEKISGIVNVISDIADQTNLLALNASIEAARAGEHGRGFAVVAEEVSKLADRSSSSTKEIEGLIRESVKDVAKGVEKARRSQAAMELIRAASQKVREMISGLTDSMAQQVGAAKEMEGALDSVRQMSQNISEATAEQTSNARQVSQAVENVNEVAQSAAAAAQQMSQATEMLADMAQELLKLTAQFRIQEIASVAEESLPAAVVAPAALPKGDVETAS